MSAETSSGNNLKKAVRKHEKKLRQISHLEEQSRSRELTKEEIEKVSDLTIWLSSSVILTFRKVLLSLLLVLLTNTILYWLQNAEKYLIL